MMSCYRYQWMTYGEAGAARSALGSGLVKHGIPKASYSSKNASFVAYSFYRLNIVLVLKCLF